MTSFSPISLYLGGAAEEKIYRCCLRQGPLSMSELATLTKMKRPSLYPMVADLRQRGFLTTVPRGKRTAYDAAPPQTFLRLHEEQTAALQNHIVELEQLRLGQQVLPHISIVHPEGISALYARINAEVRNGTDVRFLTSIGDLERYMPTVLSQYFEALKHEKRSEVRELIAFENQGKTYTRRLRTNGFLHPCRLLPRGTTIKNDLVLFGSTAVCIACSQRPWALVIDDSRIVATLRTLYDSLWEQGKPR